MYFLSEEFLDQKIKDEYKDVSPRPKFSKKEMITIVVIILTLILTFKVFY